MANALKNMFAEHGYNLISLPKAGIAPLLLLYKSGADVTSANSALQDLFPGRTAPSTKRNKGVLPILGTAEITFKTEAGLNFLQALLQTLKMGKAKADVNINILDTLTFRFENIKEDYIELLSLDSFLTKARPDLENFRSFGKKLMDSELYVVNSVLKSTSFTIEMRDKSGQNINVAAQVKGILESNVKIDHNNAHAITLSHQDQQVPLAFAFKAQHIIYDKPSFWSGQPGGFHVIDLKGATMRGKGALNTEPLELGLSTAGL